MSAEDTHYQPPYTRTALMLRRDAEISEALGKLTVPSEAALSPKLRRERRIRTVQASLEIEQNTLTLDQVTAILEGKRVIGHPREIQEVRSAFAAYDGLQDWSPGSVEDLLAAHRVLMEGLVDDPGKFRQKGVGIMRGTQVVHMAPPAERVPFQVRDLLEWLATVDEHPLVISCVFHYELEFIHPFSDGNGRMGRLWQTLILSRWKPLLAYLPVETVIRDRQYRYYQVLAQSDQQANATPFVEFMLETLKDALTETVATDQVSDQVSDQVMRLLNVLEGQTASASELMRQLKLSHRPNFRKNYLEPALQAGWLERTAPDSPRSPKQRYRLTRQGRRLADSKL